MKLWNCKPEAIYSMNMQDRNGGDCNLVLPESNLEKDLGFYHNRLNLKNPLCEHMPKQEDFRISFGSHTEDLLVQLFKTLVQPVVQYEHTVW